MDFGDLIPIISIIATAWVIVSILHYKQAKRLPGPTGSSAASVEDARDKARLAHENETLRRTIERLEQRTAVLERIATDPVERTAREIESLR